jgi:GT2 family glycosyltransferase
MSQKGELTIIIPTWNRRELLQKCLTSLTRQTAKCSVLVVDNGSTDSTREMCESEFSQFDYLHLTSNQGFARAVNAGIRQTHTEFVALLNNDTEADSDWVKTGLEAFDRYPDYWFFASRMINYFQPRYLDSAGDCYKRTGLPLKRGFGQPVEEHQNPEAVLGASAGAAFYRKLLFQKIGFFDEDFFIYLEDVDLSLRAQLHGMDCLYLPDAIVFHIEAASDVDRTLDSGSSGPHPFYSENRVFWITRNRWQLMITYQPIRNLPWLLYGWSRSFLFHLFKGGFTTSFLKGLWAGIKLTFLALRKRRRLRDSRTITNQGLCQILNRC